MRKTDLEKCRLAHPTPPPPPRDPTPPPPPCEATPSLEKEPTHRHKPKPGGNTLNSLLAGVTNTKKRKQII